MTIPLYTLFSALGLMWAYSQYLGGINTTQLNPVAHTYVLVSFWLHFIIVASLVTGIIYFLLKILKASEKQKRITAIVTGIIATIWVFSDGQLYSLLNLHFNWFVFHSLMQKDAIAVIGITPMTVVGSTIPLLILLTPYFLLKPLSKYRIKLGELTKRKVFTFAASLLLLLVADKLTYSYFYFKAHPFVFELRNAVPAYVVPHSWYIRKFYGAILGKDSRIAFTEKLEGQISNHLASENGARFNYPGNINASNTKFDRPLNILLVVAESLREENVTKETAPNYFALADEEIIARRHFSSSNCTHFGLFSLLYGISPFYFHDARLTNTMPISMDAVFANNYSIYNTLSRTMKWYDMEEFAFGSSYTTFLPPDGRNYERDRAATDESIRIAQQHQESGKPYFNFVYYYTTHYNYDHPDDLTIFTPELVGDFGIADKDKRDPLINRYKNSIYYVDSELGRLVKGLKESGAWDNTIVIFTADHGEEFWEENALGHNTGLNRYQTQVPMLIHIPGVGHKDITKLTSHLDVMQTILSEIGIDEELQLGFQGNNMLTDDTHPIYIGNCHYQRPQSYAILAGDDQLIVEMEGNTPQIIAPKYGQKAMPDDVAERSVLGLFKMFRTFKSF